VAFSNTTEPGVRHFIPPLKDVGFRAAKPAVRRDCTSVPGARPTRCRLIT